MGIGSTHRKRITTMLKHMGKTIIVHKDFNSEEATSFEARGMNEKDEQSSNQVIFQFSEQLDISVDSVLQVKGSRDYWRVTDTEDIFIDNIFISFDVRVEKINSVGKQTRPTKSLGTIFNLQGTHARVNFNSNDNSVNISHQNTENVFADMRQVIQNQIQNESDKAQILSKIDELEKSVGTKEFLTKYQEFIGTTADHISLIAMFIPYLTKLLDS